MLPPSKKVLAIDFLVLDHENSREAVVEGDPTTPAQRQQS